MVAASLDPTADISTHSTPAPMHTLTSPPAPSDTPDTASTTRQGHCSCLHVDEAQDKEIETMKKDLKAVLDLLKEKEIEMKS